jgi:hypothetical protein
MSSFEREPRPKQTGLNILTEGGTCGPPGLGAPEEKLHIPLLSVIQIPFAPQPPPGHGSCAPIRHEHGKHEGKTVPWIGTLRRNQHLERLGGSGGNPVPALFVQGRGGQNEPGAFALRRPTIWKQSDGDRRTTLRGEGQRLRDHVNSSRKGQRCGKAHFFRHISRIHNVKLDFRDLAHDERGRILSRGAQPERAHRAKLNLCMRVTVHRRFVDAGHGVAEPLNPCGRGRIGAHEENPDHRFPRFESEFAGGENEAPQRRKRHGLLESLELSTPILDAERERDHVAWLHLRPWLRLKVDFHTPFVIKDGAGDRVGVGLLSPQRQGREGPEESDEPSSGDPLPRSRPSFRRWRMNGATTGVHAAPRREA